MVFRALAPLVVILRERMLAGARQRFLPAAERGLQARRDGLETIGGERPLRDALRPLAQHGGRSVQHFFDTSLLLGLLFARH